MSQTQTNVDLANSDPPPLYAENFIWSMDARSGVVIATRPVGKSVRSESELEDKRNKRSRKVATHSLNWNQITDIAIHSKNAFHFIWRINRTAMQ